MKTFSTALVLCEWNLTANHKMTSNVALSCFFVVGLKQAVQCKQKYVCYLRQWSSCGVALTHCKLHIDSIFRYSDVVFCITDMIIQSNHFYNTVGRFPQRDSISRTRMPFEFKTLIWSFWSITDAVVMFINAICVLVRAFVVRTKSLWKKYGVATFETNRKFVYSFSYMSDIFDILHCRKNYSCSLSMNDNLLFPWELYNCSRCECKFPNTFLCEVYVFHFIQNIYDGMVSSNMIKPASGGR